MTDTEIINAIVTSLNAGTTKIQCSHLERYDYLRTNLSLVNVATHQEFQSTYAGLFQLRFMQRPDNFAAYFTLMETAKAQPTGHSFQGLLQQYYNQTNRWEVSFVSKLIAIIDPNRSVWDSLVSKRLRLTLPTIKTAQTCSAAYAQLEQRMSRILHDPHFPSVTAAFDNRFPRRNYHPMRVLDATIWGLG